MSEQARKNRYTLRKRLTAGLLAGVILVSGLGSLMPTNSAKAGIPVTIDEDLTQIRENIHRGIVDTLIVSSMSAVGNAVNYFLTTIAYQMANNLASGCPEGPCFGTKFWKQAVDEAWKGALATAITDFAQLTLGLDICNASDLNLNIAIQLGLLNELRPPAPRCTLDQISQNWDAFVDSVETGEAFEQMAPIFVPGESPLGFNLTVMGKSLEVVNKAKEEAKLKELGEMMNGGWRSVLDPVSGRVISPSSVVEQEYVQMRTQQARGNEEWGRAQMMGSAAARIGQGIVTNVISVFTQTLISRFWNRMVQGLLSAEEAAYLEPDLVLNYEAILSPAPTEQAGLLEAQYNTPKPRDAGIYNPVEDFMSCPGENRGPQHCVIDAQFATAIEIGRSESMTVREALKRGYLHGDWPMISSNNTQANQDWNCFSYGYCEGNLKKLRAARIIPIGWEIAAHKAGSNVTLQDVVNGFYNCNAKGEMDPEHQWCHLIDPDWVIKAPVTQCRAMGYTPFLLSPSAAARHEACVDPVTCLKEDDLGNCIGGWGYCTKERNVWRFMGDSCPEYYNSCRTLTSTTNGRTSNFLVNTMDRGICNADNAGCRAYSTQPNTLRCQLKELCSENEGCVCQMDPSVGDSCKVFYGDSACTTPNGQACEMGTTCSNKTTGCPCDIKRTCRVQKDQIFCDVKDGDSISNSDDWLFSPLLHVNRKIAKCDGDADGCTALIPLDYTNSLNLIRNGGFEEMETVGNSSTPNHAKYWLPIKGVTTNLHAGYVSTNGSKAADGNNAASMTIAPTNCSLSSACTLDEGCPCVQAQGSGANKYEDFLCVVDKFDTSCTQDVRLRQGGITFRANKTYNFSAVAIFNSNSPVKASADLHFFDANGKRIVVKPGDVVSNDKIVYVSDDGQVYRRDEKDFTGISCASWHSANSTSDDYAVIDWQASKHNQSGNTYVYVSCQFSVVGDYPIATAMLAMSSQAAGNAFIDAVQLEEGVGTRFHEGYGGSVGLVYAKVAPESLGCTGEEGEPTECGNYSGVCRETEAGCNLYTPVEGGVPISGLAADQDRCPAECVGYDTFKQEATNFDPVRFPVYFIPDTAKACTESEVGCTEFTNLADESLGYYQSLRFCVPEGTADTATYYTWEGSDTTGYQLKTWNFKQSGATAVAGGVCCADGECQIKSSSAQYCTGLTTASDVCDNGDCTTGDPTTRNLAPCTKLTGSNTTTCNSHSSTSPSGSIVGFCSQYEIDRGDLDCREFYDVDGHRHYRRASAVVEVTDNCERFRLGGIDEYQCKYETQGDWDATKQACVYRFDTEKSQSCSESISGCRAYKGNAAGNVRQLFMDTFEEDLGAWYDMSSTDHISISSQSLNVGGHSLESAYVGYSIDANKYLIHSAYRQLGTQIKSGKTYSVEFWAQGYGSMDVKISKGSSMTCELAEQCNAESGDCSCTEPLTGTVCLVQKGSTTCTIPTISSVGPTCSLGYVCNDSAGCTCVDEVTGRTCTVAKNYGACNVGSSFGRITLNSDWTHYRLGPLEMAFGDEEPYTASLLFYLDKGASSALGEQNMNFYLDNVMLEETQANHYLVKDSWNTPISCDQTTSGIYSPQEMLGCRAYIDIDDQKVSLRSFDKLCRERAAGCQAYGNTQNTPDQPYATSYNAVCRLNRGAGTVFDGKKVCSPTPIKCFLPSVCSGDKCTCETRVSNNSESMSCLVEVGESDCDVPTTAPENGVTCSCDYYSKQGVIEDSCQVQIGSTSCNFTLPGYDDQTPTHEAKDRVRLPADERVYLVTRKHRCDQGDMGCKVMAEPVMTYEAACACRGDNCTPNSGKSTDLNCSGDGACICQSDSGCTCRVIDPVTTLQIGFCGIAQGQSGCTAALEFGTVKQWRAVALKDVPANYDTALCTEEALMCEEYKGKDSVFYLKDPGSKICEYRDGVSYNGAVRSGFFRKSDTGVLVPCSPELLRGDNFYGLFRNSDQYCRLPFSSGSSVSGGICKNGAGCPCSVNGITVCRVGKGYSSCGYNGWVGQCESKYDYCEEFVDRMQTSPANPDGYPYYYIVNSKLDKESCKGQASLRQGCVLLDRTSVPNKTSSAAVTYYRSEKNDNQPVAPENCDPSLPPDARPDQCEKRCRRILDGACSEPTSLDVSCSDDADCSAGNKCQSGKCANETMTYYQSCVRDTDCKSTCVSNKCSHNLKLSCNTDNDCARTCEGNLHYANACSSNSDCNASLGEECQVITNISDYSAFCAQENNITGSYRNDNDSNIILKARLDRECAEWLTCNSANETWDEQKGENVNICDGFVLCNKAETGSEKSRCTSILRSPREILSPESYAQRDVSWYGEDLSGYSLWNTYPLEYVTPVFMPKRACYSPVDDETIKDNGYAKTCQTDDGCGTGEICIQMNGVCKNGKEFLNDRPCRDNSDCNLKGGEFCATSYLSTTRFGVVFDRSVSCNRDSDCKAALFGLPASEENGSCTNHMCVWNFRAGGAFSPGDASLASCRAYPEETSPYGPSVVHPFDSPDESSLQGGYSRFGNALTKKENFAGAEVCTVANDCECAYTTITYGTGDERFYSYPGATSQPVTYNEEDNSTAGRYQSAYAYPGLCVGGPYDGKRCIPGAGSDAASKSLPSGLDDKTTGLTNKYSGCGPAAAGGVCRPWTKIQYFRGWPGFCVDPDSSMNRDGTSNLYGCDLWLPVEQMDGAPDLANQYRNAGYNPPDNKMMYCAVAQGNAIGKAAPAEGVDEQVVVDEFCDIYATAECIRVPPDYHWTVLEDSKDLYDEYVASKPYCNAHPTDCDKGIPIQYLNVSGEGPVISSSEREAGNYEVVIYDEGGRDRNMLFAYDDGGVDGEAYDNLWYGPKWLDTKLDGSKKYDTVEGGDLWWPNHPDKVRQPYEYGIYDNGESFESLGLTRDKIVAFKVELYESGYSFYLWPGNGWQYSAGNDAKDSKSFANGFHDDFSSGSTGVNCFGDAIWEEKSDDHGSCQEWQGYCVGIKVNFSPSADASGHHEDQADIFRYFHTNSCVNETGGFGDHIRITALLRENCSELQVVHDIERPGFTSVAWTDRMYRGSVGGAAAIGNLVWRSQPMDTARTMSDGTDPSIYPFGQAAVPEGEESRDQNGEYQITEPHPLPIWNSEYGSPYTTIRHDETATKKSYPMDINYNKGELKPDYEPDSTRLGSYGVGGIPAASVGKLGRSDVLKIVDRWSGNTAFPEVGQGSFEDAHTHAVNTLEQIFVKSWRSYIWPPGSDTKFETGYTKVSKGSPYENTNGPYDSRTEYGNQANAPKLSAPDLYDCMASNPRLCTEATPVTASSISTIEVDKEDSLETPVGSIQAKILFYAWADKDHMPIRRLIVDYGDGDDGRITDGWFRNHRGCVKDGATGNCDEDKAYCVKADPAADFGRQPQACESSYFSFEHTYICTDSMINDPDPANRLPACDTLNPVYPCIGSDSNEAVCVFKPRVQIMDNWGFCNGLCPGGFDQHDTCFNGENPSLVAEPFVMDRDGDGVIDATTKTIDSDGNGTLDMSEQAYADKVFAANECPNILNNRSYRWIINGKLVRPYTEYSKEIKVKPSGSSVSPDDVIPECKMTSSAASTSQGAWELSSSSALPEFTSSTSPFTDAVNQVTCASTAYCKVPDGNICPSSHKPVGDSSGNKYCFPLYDGIDPNKDYPGSYFTQTISGACTSGFQKICDGPIGCICYKFLDI